MKRKLLGMTGALAALALGLALTGCENPSIGEDGSSYTVHFSAGDGSGTAPVSQADKKYGEKITLPGQEDMIAPAGRVFAGWGLSRNDAMTYYKAGAEYSVEGYSNTTFTAQWRKPIAISYDAGAGGGAPPAPRPEAKAGDTITLPGQGDMTAPGEDQGFNGWSDDSGKTGAAGSSYTIDWERNENLTFTARWGTLLLVTYKVGEGSGAPPQSQSVVTGGTITLPGQGDMTAPEGKGFSGWSFPPEGSLQAGGEYPVIADITFTAQWVTLCRVTYNVGEGSGAPPQSQIVLPGEKITLPEQGDIIAPDGKGFSGWRHSASSNTYKAGDEFAVTGNTRFEAQWATLITVTYDMGEGFGTPPPPQGVVPQGTITLPGQGDMIAPAGRVFAGWGLGRNDAMTYYKAGAEYSVGGYGNTTFTALWGNPITVAYDASGGGAPPPPQSVVPGDTITLPGQGDMTAPDESLGFNGWRYNGTNYPAGSSYTIDWNHNGGITFTARWGTLLLVTYDAGEGSGTLPPSQSVLQGGTITLPGQGDMTAPAGRGFSGWTTLPPGPDPGGPIHVGTGSEYTVNNDTTFTAQWATLYTVTYSVGDGSGTPPSQDILLKGTITLPDQEDMIAPAGYYFSGWRHSDHTYYKAGDEFAVTANTRFEAQWEALITVGYSVGDGSGTPPPSQTGVKAGEKITLPEQGDMVARTGYYFSGWRHQYSGIYQASSEYTIDGGITFTAQWSRPFTITYSVGDGSGTPPAAESFKEKEKETITLPEPRDIIPPTGGYFSGWRNSATGATYQAGDTYTVNYSYFDVTFTAYWGGTITVTYSVGEGSGTPPPSESKKQGETITLPEPGGMQAAGYVFTGWKDSYNERNYAAGEEYFLPSPSSYSYTVTFTAQWQNKGIYLGLIRFAGDAGNIGSDNYYYLSGSSKSSIQSYLNNQYAKASQSGTALYYAVHKALANLTVTESTIKSDIHSVYLITFTDGLDNGSFGASNANPIEGKSGVSSANYAAYIQEQITSRKIGGQSINAYSVGVKGFDVTDTNLFDTTLSSIASSNDNVTTLTDFSAVTETLAQIAEGIDVSVDKTINFNMKTTQSDPGTIFRMTFDSGVSDPASATRYIEGTLAYDNETKVYSLTNIKYSSGMSSESGATIEGKTSGTTVVFTFYGIEGYDPQTDKDSVKQWTKTSGSSSWQVDSEYTAEGAENTAVNADTTLIWLVLDASISLSDSQISQVRTAISNFIDKLYERIQP